MVDDIVAISALVDYVPTEDVAPIKHIAQIIADLFECPCNFTPLDEEMWEVCGDDCVDDNIECWQRVIKKKLSGMDGVSNE